MYKNTTTSSPRKRLQFIPSPQASFGPSRTCSVIRLRWMDQLSTPADTYIGGTLLQGITSPSLNLSPNPNPNSSELFRPTSGVARGGTNVDVGAQALLETVRILVFLWTLFFMSLFSRPFLS